MTTNFNRPTLAELISRIQSDIEGELAGSASRLRRRFEKGLAYAVARASHGMHGHIAWVAEQILPDTAIEFFVLRWGRLFGVFRRPATQAAGPITVTGTGGTLPAETEWVRASDGAIFLVNAEVTGITSATAQVTAVVAGAGGNLVAGETLSLVSPLPGVISTATVAAPGIVNGFEIESLDSFLERLLDRIQRPPMGGAKGDHVTWALEVAGVIAAWEFPRRRANGSRQPGYVAVTYLLDGYTIPGAEHVAAMQDHLDTYSAAEVEVFAPTPVILNWHALLTPRENPDVEAAVTLEVQAAIRRDAAIGDGSGQGTIEISRLREAISSAEGEISHQLLSPSGDVVPAFGEIIVPGTGSYEP